MSTKNPHKNAGQLAACFAPLPGDRELLDELDELVHHAALGDRHAIGAIAFAFSPLLLEEAALELGPDDEQDAPDVVQDFYVKLLERALRFPAIRGGAIPWMRRMVRLLAREHLRARDPGGDQAG